MTNPELQSNQPNVDSPLPVLSLVFAFIVPLLGAILGHVALSQIRQGKISSNNQGLAKAGMIVGWVFTGLTFLFIALYVLLVVWAVSSGVTID
jgi:large-conductance mechanosensitive channel